MAEYQCVNDVDPIHTERSVIERRTSGKHHGKTRQSNPPATLRAVSQNLRSAQLDLTSSDHPQQSHDAQQS